MSNPIRLSNDTCNEILAFIREKTPPGTVVIINLAVSQGQEDVFVLQTLRTVGIQETIVIMLDTVKAYVENNNIQLNETENENPPV